MISLLSSGLPRSTSRLALLDADVGLDQLGLGLLQRALEGTRVDLEQQVAGLHLLRRR